MGLFGPQWAELLHIFHLRSYFYDVIYVIAGFPWASMGGIVTQNSSEIEILWRKSRHYIVLEFANINILR